MTKTSIRNCGDCIHCEMCKWIDDMVGDNTCDWFKECEDFSPIHMKETESEDKG